jgi:2,4-dienoyl-CoA reductase-like NADH-dependent reductase (Old Yellow Enzyme family)
MARPLILEPDLPNKMRDGRSTVALCDSCNRCVVAVDMVPIGCYNEHLNPSAQVLTAIGI